MEMFKENDRVTFVGDSITHEGYFISILKQYYDTYYGGEKVKFFNCGIAGARIPTVLKYFEEDVVPTKPTIAFLMIGTNDSNRNDLLNPNEEERETNLNNSFETYKKNLVTILNEIKKLTSNIILMTPPIYNEFGKGVDTPDMPYLKGGFALMKRYAEYVKEFAKENNYPCIDNFNALAEATETNSNLFREDYTHPNYDGHLVIAKEILKAQNLKIGEDFKFKNEYQIWHDEYYKVRDAFAFRSMICPEAKERSEIEKIANDYILDHSKSEVGLEQYMCSLADHCLENYRLDIVSKFLN